METDKNAYPIGAAGGLPQRLYFFDAARGVASLIVVLSHWKHFFYVGTRLSKSFDADRQPYYGLLSDCYDHGGGPSVQFFFALSGFIFFWMYLDRIADGRCPIRRFTVLRFARLYPLHVTTLVGVACLQVVYWRESHTSFVYQWNDAYHFVLNLLFVQCWGLERGMSFDGPSWSISIEVGLYLAFFVLAYTKVLSLRGAILIAAAAHLIPRYWPGNRWSVPIESFFVGGATYYLLVFYAKRRSIATDVAVLALAAAAWLPFGLSHFGVAAGLGAHRTRVFVLFPVTLAGLLVADMRWSAIGRRFSWLGDVSYSTYLLHFPLQLCCVLLFRSFGYGDDIFYQPAFFVGFFGVLLVVSVTCYRFFEKPAQGYVRGFFGC